jgi:hypothetical protein
LADVLSSFTRVESAILSIPVGKGIWKKIRFNNLDIHSMMSICDVVEEEYRLGLDKRIADICLFILGIFPAYAERDYRYPSSGEVRPHLRAKFRISPEDYERLGITFIILATKPLSEP